MSPKRDLGFFITYLMSMTFGFLAESHRPFSAFPPLIGFLIAFTFTFISILTVCVIAWLFTTGDGEE